MEIASSNDKYVGMDSSILMEMAHSQNISQKQKNAAVSQQFEAMYRHFFTDAISESVAQGGGFGVSNILQQQLNQKISTSSGSNDHSSDQEEGVSE